MMGGRLPLAASAGVMSANPNATKAARENEYWMEVFMTRKKTSESHPGSKEKVMRYTKE
jgi:hypothetical protein